MTDKEIEKALKVCGSSRRNCNKCPYNDTSCDYKNQEALDYIKRLKVENKELRKVKVVYAIVDYCADDLAKALKENDRLKAEQEQVHKETAKEMLQELKDRSVWFIESPIGKDHFDEQINEMCQKYGIEVDE